MQRLQNQIEFILEADRLKNIVRHSLLADGSRRENSAEHSWHLALAIMVLGEYATEKIDVAHTVKLAIVHDLVEIDAGDTFVYDVQGVAVQAERERRAADRIFSLLPPDQAEPFRALWDEFEAARTPEARFAAAIDRLCPIVLNFQTNGHSWREHGITADRVRARNLPAFEAAPELGRFVRQLIDEAVGRGYIREPMPVEASAVVPPLATG